MQNLITWRFWFNLRPEPLQPLFVKIFLVLLVLLLIATIITALKQRKKGFYKNIWKQAYGFSLGNLLIGLILFFFNDQRAAFLSARFWLAIWVVVMIFWFWQFIKGYRLIPIKKQQLSKDKEFKKYLP